MHLTVKEFSLAKPSEHSFNSKRSSSTSNNAESRTGLFKKRRVTPKFTDQLSSPNDTAEFKYGVSEISSTGEFRPVSLKLRSSSQNCSKEYNLSERRSVKTKLYP